LTVTSNAAIAAVQGCEAGGWFSPLPVTLFDEWLNGRDVMGVAFSATVIDIRFALPQSWGLASQAGAAPSRG